MFKEMSNPELLRMIVNLQRDLERVTTRLWALEHEPTDVKKFDSFEEKISNWKAELIHLGKIIEAWDCKISGFQSQIDRLEKADLRLYEKIQKQGEKEDWKQDEKTWFKIKPIAKTKPKVKAKVKLKAKAKPKRKK